MPKRAMTSYRILVSVDAVRHYHEVIQNDNKGTNEYCEAKIAVEQAVPEYIHRKCWEIAKQIHFLEQITIANKGQWMEVMDDIKRNLEHMEN